MKAFTSGTHKFARHHFARHYFTAILIGMVYLLVVTGCSSSSPTNADTGPAGWFWQNPLPQGLPLDAVSFTAANHGTAVGDRGGN